MYSRTQSMLKIVKRGMWVSVVGFILQWNSYTVLADQVHPPEKEEYIDAVNRLATRAPTEEMRQAATELKALVTSLGWTTMGAQETCPVGSQCQERLDAAPKNVRDAAEAEQFSTSVYQCLSDNDRCIKQGWRATICDMILIVCVAHHLVP